MKPAMTTPRAARRQAARKTARSIAGAIAPPASVPEKPPEVLANATEVGHLTPGDLALLQKGEAAVALAQANLQFVKDHISESYSLDQFSYVHKDGTIYRLNPEKLTGEKGG